MRLMAWCVSDKLGGGERYLLHLLAALPDGWEPLVVCPAGPVSEYAAGLDLPVRLTRVGPKLGRRTASRILATYPRQRREFDRIVREGRPDHLLLHYKLEQLLWGGRDLGVPVTILEHGPVPTLIGRVAPARRRYARAVARAAHVFAASEPARRALAAYGREATMLPAGVEVQAPPAAAVAEERARLTRGLPAGTRLAVHAGRLEPAKGTREAIDAVLATSSDAIVVAGRGSLADELERRAATEPRLLFEGFRDDPATLIAAADYGILLSRDPGEGRPLFALECLALGKPVVASRQPALVALAAEPGVTGVCFDAVPGVLPTQRPLAANWSETADTLVSALLQG